MRALRIMFAVVATVPLFILLAFATDPHVEGGGIVYVENPNSIVIAGVKQLWKWAKS